MNKIARKKIQLNREVLKTLTPQQAQWAAGGAGRPSNNPAACKISTNDPTACRISSADPLVC